MTSHDLSEYYHYGLQKKKKKKRLITSKPPSKKENKHRYIAVTETTARSRPMEPYDVKGKDVHSAILGSHIVRQGGK